MPISYETSQLLKCTVSFAYTKYSINRVNIGNINKSPSGVGGPTRSAAANNFFAETRQSLINDPNATEFINPQTFIEKFGGGRTLPDRINTDIA